MLLNGFTGCGGLQEKSKCNAAKIWAQGSFTERAPQASQSNQLFVFGWGSLSNSNDFWRSGPAQNGSRRILLSCSQRPLASESPCCETCSCCFLQNQHYHACVWVCETSCPLCLSESQHDSHKNGGVRPNNVDHPQCLEFPWGLSGSFKGHVEGC